MDTKRMTKSGKVMDAEYFMKPEKIKRVKKIMKATVVGFSICLLAATVPASCTEARTVSGLNRKKITLTVGKKAVIKVKKTGKKKIKWKSSNPKVVSVKKKGKAKARLTAKKKGKATITANINGKKYKCKVTVKKGAVNKQPDPYDYYDRNHRITNYEWERSQAVVKEVLGENYEQIPEIERCWKLALWECDYMSYNHEAAQSGKGEQTAHEVFLNGGKGVCGAYTDLYYCLLTAAGIENVKAMNTSHVHIWNVVKVDGQWYNCDITWMDDGRNGYTPVEGKEAIDAPVNDYEQFMKSDTVFEGAFHKAERDPERKYTDLGGSSAYSLNPPHCTSTKYDDNRYEEVVTVRQIPAGTKTVVEYGTRTGEWKTGYVFTSITKSEYEQALQEYNTLNGLSGDRENFTMYNEKGEAVYYHRSERQETVYTEKREVRYNYDSNRFTRGEY